MEEGGDETFLGVHISMAIIDAVLKLSVTLALALYNKHVVDRESSVLSSFQRLYDFLMHGFSVSNPTGATSTTQNFTPRLKGASLRSLHHRGSVREMIHR